MSILGIDVRVTVQIKIKFNILDNMVKCKFLRFYHTDFECTDLQEKSKIKSWMYTMVGIPKPQSFQKKFCAHALYIFCPSYHENFVFKGILNII